MTDGRTTGQTILRTNRKTVLRTICRADESRNRLTDKRTNRFTDEPTNSLTDERRYLLTGEPTNRYTDERTNRLTDKRKNHLIDEPTNSLSDERRNLLTDERTNHLTDKRTNRLTELLRRDQNDRRELGKAFKYSCDGKDRRKTVDPHSRLSSRPIFSEERREHARAHATCESMCVTGRPQTRKARVCIVLEVARHYRAPKRSRRGRGRAWLARSIGS